jgi:hypothetical protein
MAELTRKTWERKFRADAKADNLAIFREHLRCLDLEGKTTAESMLEGTVAVVDACCAIAQIKRHSTARFLAAQIYDSAKSDTGTCSLTFDIWGDACARLLVAADLKIPGIAHLVGEPFYDYQVTYFTGALMSGLDHNPDSHYGIDGKAGDVSWLETFLSSDLVFNLPIESCYDNDNLIGNFYVTQRRPQ